jgi:transposase
VGIDWADAKHAVCGQAAGSTTQACRQLDHTPEALDAWARALQARCAGRPIAGGLALHQGPLVSALRQDDFFGLVPSNPGTLATYRDAFTPRPAKDDPPDADLPRALVLTHRDTLQPLHPQSPAMRALAQLVDHRRCVIGDTGRVTHRLTRTLKNSFPHVLQWFEDKDTLLFCDFLAPWPTLTAAHLARRTTLEGFFRTHHVRYGHVIDRRLQAIKSATPLTTDAGVIAPHALLVQALLVQALVAQLRVLLQAMTDFDQAMAQRAQSHPDCSCFAALPGAGPVFAPRLLVAFGEQRERYASAAELQQFAGIAPVTERSGKKCWVHWRFQCPTFLRQTFVEWAAESIRHSFWARVYYQQQRDAGKAHQAAVRALAFKWIRILFRCWQDRTPYDESVYLNALNRRGSSLIQNLAKES